MTEKIVPNEVFEALVALNVGSYMYSEMKEMHKLTVSFAQGLEVAEKLDIKPPSGLVVQSFEEILMRLNHIKEMLKLFGETNHEIMQKYKEVMGIEAFVVSEIPGLEDKILTDPRIERLKVLINETMDECKLRLGGEQLASDFAKLLADTLKEQGDNGTSAN